MTQLEDCFALAMDIGGSKADIGFVSLQGQVLGKIDKHPVPFDEKGIADPDKIISLMGPYVEQASSKSGKLLGIGLSICGNIDMVTGEAVLVPNLHWRNLPFGKIVHEQFRLPVYAATDVRMAAQAEAMWGVARQARYFAWCTVGTGYGGYLFLDGKLYDGLHGFAGNFGHNTWDEVNGYLCGCGRRGCVETFVAGPAIARAGQKAVVEGRSPLLSQMATGEPVKTEMVFKAEAQGDSASHEILNEVVRLIAINLGGMINILDLELIVMGGGVVRGRPEFVQRISTEIRKYMETVEAQQELKLLMESFPNSALFGAAAEVFIHQGLL